MFKAIILGIIQGLTEFIPVSSSAHDLVTSKLLGFHAEDTSYSAAIHFATFLAALIYFRKDILRLTKALFRNAPQSDSEKSEKQLALNIIVATVPAVALAFLVDKIDFFKSISTNLLVIGITSIFFAFLLFVTDKINFNAFKHHSRKEASFRDAVLIGSSQVIAAAFPGASRSGITLTTSFWLKLDRDYATRFVFLISIPITGIASLYELLVKQSVAIDLTFASAFIAAFVSGMLAIHFLLLYIRRTSLQWLCLYRILFGLAIIGMYVMR